VTLHVILKFEHLAITNEIEKCNITLVVKA